jgi:hypothetical protein
VEWRGSWRKDEGSRKSGAVTFDLASRLVRGRRGPCPVKVRLGDSGAAEQPCSCSGSSECEIYVPSSNAHGLVHGTDANSFDFMSRRVGYYLIA